MLDRVPSTSRLRLLVVVVMIGCATLLGVGVPMLINASASGAVVIASTATPQVSVAPSATIAASATGTPTATTAASATATPTAVSLITDQMAADAVPVVARPQFVAQNTAATRKLGADGYSWAQAWPIQVDRFGNIFSIAQSFGNAHHFVFSNDGGRAWRDGTLALPGMRRGTIAYDERRDLIHVLWIAQSVDKGVQYRRYRVLRDARDRILNIVPDESATITLDRQTDGRMSYEYPILLWLDDAAFGDGGALLAIWSALSEVDGQPPRAEVRVAMTVLEQDAPNGSSWRAPIAPDRSTIGNAPQVEYSVFHTGESGPIGVSALRTRSGARSGDLYLFFGDRSGWLFKRAAWSASDRRWSGGWAAARHLSALTRSGSDYGYSNKWELRSKPVEDTVNDRVYFGFANWKDDQAGDTWSFVAIDAADQPSAIVDVYSANGPHSFAPTGDIVFDQVTARLLVSYIVTGAGKEYAYIRGYDGTREVQPATVLFDAAPVDIPLLWQGGRYRDGDSDKLLVMFRDAVNTPNPPYKGYFGAMEWVGAAGR